MISNSMSLSSLCARMLNSEVNSQIVATCRAGNVTNHTCHVLNKHQMPADSQSFFQECQWHKKKKKNNGHGAVNSSSLLEEL